MDHLWNTIVGAGILLLAFAAIVLGTWILFGRQIFNFFFEDR